MIHVTIHLASKDSATRLAGHLDQAQLMAFIYIRESGEFLFRSHVPGAARGHFEVHGITKALLFTELERTCRETFGDQIMLIASTHVAHLDTQGYVEVLSVTKKI